MTGRSPPARAWPGHRFAIVLFAAILVTATASFALTMRAAALPDGAQGKMLVVFHPALSQDQMFAAIAQADGRPIRPTWIASVWVVHGQSAGFAGRLRQFGALASYREMPFSPQLAGCFAYIDAKAVELFKVRL